MLILPGYIHSFCTPEESEDYLCVFSTDLVSLFYEKTKMKSLSDTRFSFDNRNDIDILTDENRSIFAKQAVLYRLCAAVFEQSEIEKLMSPILHSPILSQCIFKITSPKSCGFRI